MVCKKKTATFFKNAWMLSCESKITEIHRAWIPVIYITMIILSEIILLYNVQ